MKPFDETKTIQEKLQQSIFKSIITLVVVIIAIFSLTLIYYSYSVYRGQADSFNDHLRKQFESIYIDYAGYLAYADESDELNRFIETKLRKEDVLYNFTQYTSEFEVKADLLVTDNNNAILLSTLEESYQNLHFDTFARFMSEKATEDHIETSVYFFKKGFSRYIMCQSLQSGGYIYVLLNGEDMNTLVRSGQANALITDRFNNVIATSNNAFVSAFNRFVIADDLHSVKLQDVNYYVSTRHLSGYDINFYTLVSMESQMTYLFICVVFLFIFGMMLFVFSRKTAQKVADENTQSIRFLIDEVKSVQRDVHHQIGNTQDEELNKIARSINELMSEVNELHAKNTELIDLRRRSEIKQLEAQFNPHFLYNTLETIRYASLMNESFVSDLIIQLTSLLRYSINIELDHVELKEDMKYIYMFLKIQKYRFDKHFSYEIDIDEQCNDFIVPKLLLQPILENSIKYGFKGKPSIHVVVKGWVENDLCMIEVKDNGDGLSESECAELQARLHSIVNNSNHLGLYNIARRLQLGFGEESDLSIQSIHHQGMIVTLKIPRKGPICSK